MAKSKPPAAKLQAKNAPRSLADATAGILLFSTTTEWRRIIAKNADAAVEDAINGLSASGLIEVRIVTQAKMSDQRTPKCRYVGGGEWWTLLQKELDRLIPETWKGRDGKPKRDLIQSGILTAIRLTSAGYDYIQAARANKLPEWKRKQPKKIETYLRCDGVDTQSIAPRLDLSAGPDKGVILFEGKRIRLTGNEELCVTSLVEKSAMTLTELRKASGDDHADRTLKNLLIKYPSLEPFIKIPGGNNRGGYSTLIKIG